MLPKKVNILGKKYKVKQVYIDVCGDCDYKKQLIRINRRMNDGQKAETLIHEIMHAVIDENGWKASEATVRGFILNFYAVMKSNPSIFNGRYE